MKKILLIVTILVKEMMSDYGLEQLQQESWLLNEKLRTTEESLRIVDAQIDQDLDSLSIRINEVAQDILDDTNENNHQYGSIVGLIALGRVIRLFGSAQSVTAITILNLLETVVGPVFTTASYAASRVEKLRTTDLGCDINQYVHVLQQYEVLLSLRDTYSILNSYQAELPSYNNPGFSGHAGELLSPGLQPELLKHNVRDFVVELKKSLSCVLDKKTPSSKDLDKCIDLIGHGMETRLDLTSDYIEILNRIEVVNDSYNDVSY